MGTAAQLAGLLVGSLLDRFGIDVAVIEEVIEEFIADPIGEPPQIHNIIWDIDWMLTGQVTWDVIGDESDIARYEVEIFMFWPDRDDPIGIPIAAMTAGPGTGHVLVDIDVDAYTAENDVDPESAHTIARVTPILLSTGEPAPGQFGIVQTFNFGGSAITVTQPTFRYVDGGGTPGDEILLIGAPSISAHRAAWIDPAPLTHRGFIFASTLLGKSIVFRSLPDDAYMAYAFEILDPIESDVRVFAHLGLLDEALESDNTASVVLHVMQEDTGGMPLGSYTSDVVTIGPLLPGEPHPMPKISVSVPAVIDPVTTLPIPTNLRIIARVEGGGLDLDHPPVLVNLRVDHTPP